MIGNRLSNRVVRAPRGPVRTCKSWLSEAAYRMAQNNLDPEVAEHPEAAHRLVRRLATGADE